MDINRSRTSIIESSPFAKADDRQGLISHELPSVVKDEQVFKSPGIEARLKSGKAHMKSRQNTQIEQPTSLGSGSSNQFASASTNQLGSYQQNNRVDFMPD